MTKVIHRANSRGTSKYDWLDSKHNFSFANYNDNQRMHFGALRVLNDDIIDAGSGFGKHPHDNMEIITIPIDGALKHSDSMGHEQIISENEVQVMSAGTGIFHSEHNASDTEAANFLQLWIYPNKKNVKPVYYQKSFDTKQANNAWQKLVSSCDSGSNQMLTIHQDAIISRVFLSKDYEIDYSLDQNSFGSFLFIVSGEIEIDGEKYFERDALGISDISNFSLKATKYSYVLNIEVPKI
ncbi:MAG: pirin family protein [Bacteroidales bacterium]|jgi:redox-sensitive bicupin YhaK (pirin superfamily)|nr:pirin family protein [Bacteroidales bacterium]